ncbi:DUF1127 domain-containing protein [Rhodobacter sp. KR11]|jgi:uncharacterized protein YjiS (DUF1127 family)|uniref:DUF1127 domain-containing protein n=1 Tax=Rhodobacter sp. KR11 TaxID=2974588 RepID=UPI0022234C01|nr:DUF1127 domain-containing protein [Rhodobacter sp. KR11]MCW1917353.1 DUF1127 domain-containing protein [Rhodobacter sp. KR11]
MELALRLRARRLATRRRFWHIIARALALHQSRKGLAALDAHMLRDIGLTAEEARREATRPLWDAPDHWQKR